ncbi:MULTISPECIES: class II fructose-bisphosphate aldolase [unclassified Peribacillus]|uniref:class II fructose-bisphosphate aldolase n=1 Tax=unclassified Peribacillus TaxID=2675266 RepID=UPI001911E5B5|nr:MULTISPECIES: class II fructose-bisphosphate aldolase [unclassified Peribacillus]MBK5460183.1 class II fructose-bisphosphate aldolase [Peribacillus sp. TH27]WMX56515.1 class II fructose-bisphosphate aldolase [Peribacillus sp. R9-11]
MLVNTKEILSAAQNGKYGVAAFNVYNLETVQAAITVAEKENHPVIIALGERYFDTVDVEGFAALVKTLAGKSSVPVSLHLDHTYEKESIIRAIRCGFTSVMYDGSKYELTENIRLTKEITEIAHMAGVSVEAEIGSVARGAFSDEEEGDGTLTDPKSAKEFVEETDVDFLAASIGTVHGMYTGKPNIDLDLLEEIRQLVGIPLVLHGGSGTPDEIIKQAVARGICKVNVNTEVSLAATSYLNQAFEQEQKAAHLSAIMAGMQEAMEPVMTKFVRLLQN